MNETNFGEYLKSLRKRKNLTLQQLEDLTGLTTAYLSMLENDKKDNPSFETIFKLSKHLGVTYENLLSKTNNDVANSTPSVENNLDLTQLMLYQNVTYEGVQLTEQQQQLIDHLLREFTRLK